MEDVRMIDFYHGEITDIMPYNLISPETKALSYAVSQAMKRLKDFSSACHMYGELSKVPEPVLDLMALELNTQYYDQTMPRKLKEQLLTQTTAWYMHAGTPEVLREFLGTVLEGGKIREWNEYGGDPFFFKAEVEVGEHEIPVGYGVEVKRQIELYKNARSWLEHVAFIIGSRSYCDVSLANAVRFRGRFYPRLNAPILKLDGIWNLSGKKLSGYDSDEKIDFYPVGQNYKLQVTENVSLREYFRSSNSTKVSADTREKIRLLSQINLKADENNGLTIKSSVCVGLRTGNVRVTTCNPLSGQWILDKDRSLNGGLSIL
jgi:P2-related tail formation protein